MSYLLIILLSALPISEWRVSVPIAILKYGIHPIVVFFLVLTGSMLPAIFVVYFIGPITTYITKKFPRLGKIIQKALHAIHEKKKGVFEKIEDLALIFFAAMPVPIIGGSYTASIASFLFGIKPKQSIVFISIGTSIGIIFMMFLTYTGKAIIE